ncbi:hypothetical protein UPYG_G00187370 [Umbra pygmaea]|uniref:C2H2-type domain-containing protein n=1 Tax=Umbra pygmaea TaxID=75934 RepID=A0ABD0WWJ0_UMBPY
MEEDSRCHGKSDQMTHGQPTSQQSSSLSHSFHCDHCGLLFKSNYFLLEHMKNTHSIEMDPSQRGGSSAHSESSAAPHRDHYNSSEGFFSCRHCLFTSSNWKVIIKHERMYHKGPVRGYGKVRTLKTQKWYLRGKQLNNKVSLPGKRNPNTGSTFQCKQGGKGSVNSKSTSKMISIPSSSLMLKNLQAQVGSSGSISKFRVVSGPSVHGSSINSSQLKLTTLQTPSNPHQVTLRSDEPFLSYEQDSRKIVSKVTEEKSHIENEQKDSHCCSLCNFSATWLEDLLAHQRSKHSYLFYNMGSKLLDNTEQQNLKSETYNGMSLTDPLVNTTKRAHENHSSSPAKKKIKPSPECAVIQSKLSGSSGFTFEVSEDEEEGNFSQSELGPSRTEVIDKIGQLEKKKSKSNRKILYSCKHCDYSHKSYRGVSTHYQRMHPYVRYDLQYIVDPNSWTATFRCLDCPVDFATPDDLKSHYTDHHPLSPDVFKMRSDQLDLAYKCFACPFTISNGKFLKSHYKNIHPELEISNPLMYCSFTSKPSEDESFKSQHLGETFSPKIPVSSGRSPSPKACSVSVGGDENLYRCNHCSFSHISVVVMLVHYQKKHPNAGMTIDNIKQALATSRKPVEETCVSPGKISLEQFNVTNVKPNTTLCRPNVALEDVANMFFCQHCHYGNLTVRGVLNHQRSRHSDFKATVEQIHLHTAEVRSQSKSSPGIATVSPSPTKNNVELEEVTFSDTSPVISSVSQANAKSLYFCQFCEYCNSTVRGVMNHQKLRHTTRKSTAERIIKHTAVVRKNHKMRRGLIHSKSYPSHHNVTAKNVTNHTAEVCGQSEKPTSTEFDLSNSPIEFSVENKAEELFFCQFCNYGNPRVLGVLNHQKLRHRSLETSTKAILQYTSELCSQKEQTQSAGLDSSNTSVLISDDGNEGCNLYFCQVCNYGNPSIRGVLNHQKKRHRELKQTPSDIFRHTAEVQGQAKQMSKKVNSTPILPRPLVTEEAVLYCQHCNYSNPTMRVVVDHQRKRHPHLNCTAKQILDYTAMILAQTSKSPNASFLTSDVVQEELDEFFCQYCDYSNSTVRGILNHQHKMHSDLGTNTAQILRHTVVVRGQTKKSNSEVVNSPHTHPLENDEVDNMFFCQICNYSNPTPKGVLSHQSKKHLNLKANAKQILQYTAMVCKSQPVQEDTLNSSQQEVGKLFYCQHCDYVNLTVRGILNHQKLKHSDLKASADQVLTYSSSVHRSNQKAKIHHGNTSSKKASQSCSKKAAPLRSIKSRQSLKCRYCSYTTPHIYLLKRHMRINHQEKAPITTIIRWAYQDGYLQAGYHCEWCVCSHVEAKGLLRHYRQRHPDKNTGLQSIILRLHAGPKNSRSEEATPNPESDVILESITLPHDEVQNTPLSFQSRGEDADVFPCRACPFKATSMGGISSHYRVVHPWSVKEDGSVLDVISSRRTEEPEVQEPLDIHETSKSSETHKCPICSSEFNTLHGMFTHCGRKHPEFDIKGHEEADVHDTSKPSRNFLCPVCSGKFNTLHGMFTHCGKKHPEYDMSNYEKEPEGEPSTSEGTLVYRCSVCPYVNSRPHGILTHSQMRHPAFKVSAERLDQEIVHFTDPDECVKVRMGRRIGMAGFRCNMCPVIHAKFKKLKAHYEMDHKRSASNMFKPALKQSAAIKKQLLSKYRGSQNSISQAAILKNGKSIIVKCHLCKYFCTTKKGLARHLLINHSTLAPTQEKEFSYKCALCSYTTSICKYLAAHYRRRHGNAAFINHFVPAFRPPRIPPASPNHKDSLNQEVKSPGEKIKCSCCFFQCLSEKGMVSHYAVCHPGVSPTTPKSSPKNTPHTPPKSRFQPRHQKPICKIFDPQCEKDNAWCPAKCKKCENLFLNSDLLLSIHYTNFHKEDFKQDFTILSKTEEGTEIYRCEYCKLKIQGSADLVSHLDLHRKKSVKLENEQKSKQHVSEPEKNTKSVMHERLELPDVLMTEESDSHWIVTNVESISKGMQPHLFPSTVPLTSEPEEVSAGEECKHCGRTFMSLKGLRSHERSHAAMAALKRLENVPHQQQQMFDSHIRHRPGTIKPFHCGLCRYRTSILSLLKNHLLKVHSAEHPPKDLPSSVTISQEKEHILGANDEVAPNLPESQDCNQLSDSEESDLPEKPVYAEPPDVQRQLNHYRHLAQAKSPSPPDTKPTATIEDGLFVCEFCIYTSTYIKSMRRHYINRHNGKRLVRCKDCPFFTGFRKKLDMHIETAHAIGTTEVLKDLHCPLCLYHTKNKKRMIDHIILHREEPVAPIEVCRTKLSRYLQGIVFRCHKCTFTSSSDANLSLHMQKHDDIKPYKCRLCYFDCTHLNELEAHLCEKHQVMRNHELVGQVHLEELEMTLNRVEWEETCEEELGNEEETINETTSKCGVKQEVLKEERNNMQTLGNEEEEDDKMHDEKQGFKEGNTNKESGLDKNAENISQQNKEGPMEKSLIVEQPIGCEENHCHRSEVNTKKGNEVAENTAQTCDSHNDEETKEEQYKECHDSLENDVQEEEQFIDCQEEYQEPGEINVGEHNEQYFEMPVLKNEACNYHEMPVLENEEGKVKMHSHHEKEEPDGEAVKIDGLKPECDQKGAVEENTENDAFTTLETITSTRKEKVFSCELCGRTLMNSTDLEHHVMRHGM